MVYLYQLLMYDMITIPAAVLGDYRKKTSKHSPEIYTETSVQVHISYLT